VSNITNPTRAGNLACPPAAFHLINACNKAYLLIIGGSAMNNTSNFSSQPGKRSRDMSIDWEFLPSLNHLLDRNESAPHDVPVWAETMPADFDKMEESDPFREALEGLAIREVTEPEIFKAYFGSQERPADRR
jgi:hypothetical protein